MLVSPCGGQPTPPQARALPVIVLTDASFSKMSGMIGVTIYCPYRNALFYTSSIASRTLICLLHWYERKKTYICQLELIAAVCAYTTFPDLLRGRLVHHFIDNDPAKCNLISGHSGHPDSARIIHAYNVVVHELQCQPWLGFVYSEDNLSDLPSRYEFTLLQKLGGIYRKCIFPSITLW